MNVVDKDNVLQRHQYHANRDLTKEQESIVSPKLRQMSRQQQSLTAKSHKQLPMTNFGSTVEAASLGLKKGHSNMNGSGKIKAYQTNNVRSQQFFNTSNNSR